MALLTLKPNKVNIPFFNKKEQSKIFSFMVQFLTDKDCQKITFNH